MTMTTKGKRLANTDRPIIEISQHALVTFKFLTEFVAFYLQHFGWQGKVTERATFIYDVLVVLNNFI